MKSQISWVNWGQAESKVLVCWCSFSEIMSKPDLQSCSLQGEKGSVLIAETWSVHIKGSFTQEPQWALTWWECWKQGTSHHHCILCPLSFAEKESLLSDFEHLQAERLSGSTLWAKGAPGLHFYSVRFILYRQNNLFSLWKVQYLIKNLCTFLGFISIFIWIFTFHDIFKYFQGRVCSDNKIPGWLNPFLQFLLSYLERYLLLKKSSHYRVEENFRK